MRDLGKLIVAKGFKKLPKVQKIAQSGHTDEEHTSQKVRFHWKLIPGSNPFEGKTISDVTFNE